MGDTTRCFARKGGEKSKIPITATILQVTKNETIKVKFEKDGCEQTIPSKWVEYQWSCPRCTFTNTSGSPAECAPNPGHVHPFQQNPQSRHTEPPSRQPNPETRPSAYPLPRRWQDRC